MTKCEHEGCNHPTFCKFEEPKSGKVFNSCIFHAPVEKKKGKERKFLEEFNEYFLKVIKEREKGGKTTLNCKGFKFPEIERGFEFFTDQTIDFTVDFSDAIFMGDVTFKNVKFLSKVSFSHTLFNGLYLRDVVFSNEGVDFSFVITRKHFSFIRVTFLGQSDFSNSSIKSLYIQASDFHDRAIFKFIEIVNFGVSPSKEGAVTFEQVLFRKPQSVIIADCDLQNWSFLGTNIEDIIFFREKWSKYLRFFNYYKNTSYHGKSIKRKDSWLAKLGRKVIFDEILAIKGAWRVSLQDAGSVYRRLRKNYEDKLDYETASDFHYGQMECRRRDNTRPLWDRVFTQLYKWFSSYGESYLRPLFWFLITIFGFPGLFLLQGVPTVYGIVKFNFCSLSEMFSNGFWNWLKDFYIGMTYSIALASGFRPTTDFTNTITLISSFERLFIVIFVTFFVLALRRKFKRGI